MNIYQNIGELIGNTPIMQLNKVKMAYALLGNIYAKIEYFNPTGSIKDRVAQNMLEDAIKANKISKQTTIIEPTSGNTGIGLACLCASKDLRLILTMPDTMSKERISFLKVFGAEIILTDGTKGMAGSVEKANELAKSIPNSYIPGQFENDSNPETHYKTTGKEIWQDMDGNVDIIVACIGTGGTLSGIAKYLKEQNQNIEVVGVEPASSPLISKGYAGTHQIQGIGSNFIPKTLNIKVIDKIICVSDEDAFKYAKMLAKKEGLFVGISSGAAVCAAVQLAQKNEYKNKNIVIVLPDSGDRYLSTQLGE